MCSNHVLIQLIPDERPFHYETISLGNLGISPSPQFNYSCYLTKRKSRLFLSSRDEKNVAFHNIRVSSCENDTLTWQFWVIPQTEWGIPLSTSHCIKGSNLNVFNVYWLIRIKSFEYSNESWFYSFGLFLELLDTAAISRNFAQTIVNDRLITRPISQAIDDRLWKFMQIGPIWSADAFFSAAISGVKVQQKTSCAN